MIVAFTGHRPDKLGGYDNKEFHKLVKAAIKKEVLRQIKKGADTFISGGALGVDQFAASVVLKLKRTYKIKLIIARPFPSQDKMWPEKSKRKFAKICSEADQVIDVSKDPYSPAKMMLRNRWMVDKADVLIAVWDGSAGGTSNCIKYAKSINISVISINPMKL